MKIPLPMVIFLLIIISFLSIVIAGQHSHDVIFQKAQWHFKQQYFNQNVSNLRLEIMDKIEENELKINSITQQMTAREQVYRVALLVHRGEEVFKLNECRLNNRPQCGWMGLTCIPNLYGPDLKDLTKQGDQVLIYTYDKGRSQTCSQK